MAISISPNSFSKEKTSVCDIGIQTDTPDPETATGIIILKNMRGQNLLKKNENI